MKSPRSTLASTAALLLFAALPLDASPPPVGGPGTDAAEGTYAFEGVGVLPMDSERVLENQTVIVVDGTIVWVGNASEADVPSDAVRIDGRGRWLMPGLAEMHAHVPPVQVGRPSQELLEDYMFLYIANGVTTIRGMLGSPYQIDLRSELEAEEIIGPRFYPGAPSINGNSAPNPQVAEQMIRGAAEAGYDLMKIHPGVSRETWDRMAAVANEVGLPFGGHTPTLVGVEHALRTGMTTVDHLDGYLEAASSDAEPPYGGAGAGPGQIIPNLDRDRMIELADLTADLGAFVVPTQYLWENLFRARDTETVLAYPEMAYVSPQQRQAWRQQAAGYQAPPPDLQRAFFDARDDMLVLLAERDAVMMGTDSPQLFNVPGFALHREIDVMASAGMSNFQVLRSGTTAVGRYVRDVLEEELMLGRVEAGYAADLVLLDGNPMEDLDALRERAGVMVRGRWVDAETIESGLAAIAAKHAG